MGAIVALATTASICTPATAAIRGCHNGRIAFDSVRNGARDIYVIAAPPHTGTPQEGTPPTPTATPTKITTGPEDAKPSWSPPEPNNQCEDPAPIRPTMIAFQRTDSEGNTNIYAINADAPEPSGKAVQVTHGVGTDTDPAWAPDQFDLGLSGSADQYPPIAFERNVNGHHDIFIANFDGSSETNLTNSSGADYTNPSWAARDHESWLTFDSNQGGVREIWVMEVSSFNNEFIGSTPREVTAGPLASANPSWFVFSPEKEEFELLIDTLAFAGPEKEGEPSQIDIADSTTLRLAGEAEPFDDPNTIETIALTNDKCENVSPQWAPTGEFIVYQKTCPGEKSDIYFLDPAADEASSDIDLTEHVGDNQNPDWEPEQKLGLEYFPTRPHGRRSRARGSGASFEGAEDAAGGTSLTSGILGSGTEDRKPAFSAKPAFSTEPTFSAQVKEITSRGHRRHRAILMVLMTNARAAVVGELKKGHRRVASHRWHVTGGTVQLQFQVPRRARAGMYQLRVTMQAASGATSSLTRRVRVGS